MSMRKWSPGSLAAGCAARGDSPGEVRNNLVAAIVPWDEAIWPERRLSCVRAGSGEKRL
jgi:hypothetical protein